MAVTGCSEEPRICTLIGAETGITLHYRPSDYAAAGPGAMFRICTDTTHCVQGAEDTTSLEGQLWVGLPDARGPDEVVVRLTVTSYIKEKKVLYDESARVRLSKSQPNGPGCSPTVWQASLRADPRDGLVRP